jgi:hypothetical protein
VTDRTAGFLPLWLLVARSMRNTSPRWRYLVDLAIVALLSAFVSRRHTGRPATADGRATAATDTATDGDVSVELERVNVSDDLSVATGGLDPTLAAEVLELNEDAGKLVDAAEEEFIREPIETATGGAVEVPDVEEELAHRVRRGTDVPATAVEELETLGGLFGFGWRRDRERDDRDADTEAGAADDGDEADVDDR